MSGEQEQDATDSTPPRSRRQRGRQVRHVDTLTKDEKKKLAKQNKNSHWLAEAEALIQNLVKLKAQHKGTLHGTDGARNAAAEQLGVTVWTIDNYVAAYEQNPSPDIFIGSAPGRPRGQGFTPDQEAIICFLHVTPQRETVFIDAEDDDYEVAPTSHRASPQYIHKMLQLHCPDPPKSIYQVRRYLTQLQQDDPAVDILVRYGERYLREKTLPKPRNDVPRPHMRWQLDGRPLPLYIKHDGYICTVSLLIVMDDFSRYILRARLIPRVLRDGQGIPKRAEFNKDDVGLVVASAMYCHNICPGKLYTDHGSSIVNVGKLLKELYRSDELLVDFARSIPGRPQGRGKIEQLLQQFDELLIELPGCSIPREGENAFRALNRARTDKSMLTLEQLHKRIEEFIVTLNSRPRTAREKTSRQDLWQTIGAVPSPPIRQLMLLVPERDERDVSISNWKYTFRSHEQEDDYEPIVKTDEDMYRWLVAVARPDFVPLRAAKLDDGWKNEVCLDRTDQYWCEGMLKRNQHLDPDVRNTMQNNAIARVKAERADQLAATLAVITRLGVQQTYQNQITKEPVRAQDLPVEADPSAAQASTPTPPSTTKSTVRAKNTSVRTAPPRIVEPAKRTFGVEDIPDNLFRDQEDTTS